MPTILRENGFVIRVHGPPREHPPPHVHVQRRPFEAVVILLGTANAPPSIWKVHGMKDRDVVHAFRLVEKYHAMIEQEWRRLHDPTDPH